MLVDPRKIIKQKIVCGDGFQIQQNGIDLTVDIIEEIQGGCLAKDEKHISTYKPLSTIRGLYKLESNKAYSVIFEQEVKVPEDMAAWLIHRSTLNRMGGFIMSGLYDSGFENIIGAVLRTNCPITIEKGARIAQIVFCHAESASLYKGQYNKKQ